MSVTGPVRSVEGTPTGSKESGTWERLVLSAADLVRDIDTGRGASTVYLMSLSARGVGSHRTQDMSPCRTQATEDGRDSATGSP